MSADATFAVLAFTRLLTLATASSVAISRPDAYGQSAAGRYLVETTAGIGYVDEAGRVVSRADIVAMPKGSRPDPSTYLTQTEIDAHLELFEGGVTKIKASAPNGTEGPPGGTFVVPKSVADRLISESARDVSRLEDLLGLERGTLGTNPVRVDVASPTGLRMPSGNELGANSYWVSGGRTYGGIPEATINPVAIERYQVTPLFE